MSVGVPHGKSLLKGTTLAQTGLCAATSSRVCFPSHQATGGCYASTVKPFQVSLVKPVGYLLLS
jgi:hypothetical protein